MDSRSASPALRRRSPWQLLALPIALAFIVGIFVACAIGLLQAQRRFAPDTPVFCTPTPVATVFLFVALACFAVPLGILLTNVVLWLLPFTRRVSQRTGGSARVVNVALAKIVIAIALVSAVVCAVGITSATCVSDTEVHYRPSVLAPWQTYSLTQVVEVRPMCSRGGRGGGWDIGLDLVFSDGTTVQLGSVGPWYSSASGRLLPLLRGKRVNASGVERDCPSSLRQLVMPPSARVDGGA
jgi:hypothetical protein